MEEQLISSPIVAATREQTEACAKAYVDACIGAIKTGAPHSVAYTQSEGVFRAYRGLPVAPVDFLLPPITREEALSVATAHGIDLHSPDAEERFRQVVFVDQVNRDPKETLASDFLSGLVPPAR